MKNWIYLLVTAFPFLVEGSNDYANTTPPSSSPYHPCDFEPTEINNRGVFHADGDFLYWKIFNSGMPYAVSALPNNTFGPLVVIDEKIEEVSFDYHSGFRIGAGYTTPYNEWDINGSWVSISSMERAFSSGNGVDSVLYPLWSFYLDRIVGFDFTQPVNAGAEMNTDFDVVDISLGRFFFVGSTFALKPSMGVKLAWIK